MFPALQPKSFSHEATSFGLVFSQRKEITTKMWRRGGGTLSSSNYNTETLRWVSTVSSMTLMILKNTGIQKPLLVPLLALQLPQDVISWVRGEYGLWTAFLGVLFNLFFPVPEELKLPLSLMLVVITAPFQVLQLRGNQAGLAVWAMLSSYLAYQHISRAGGIHRAFEQRILVSTLAALTLSVVPVILMCRGF